MTIEFKPWPKTPRLSNSSMVITEKIDGTNSCVIIQESTEDVAGLTLSTYEVAAQSRNRLITPEDDNYGFARWVRVNAEALTETLGPGYHYGEWWGSGIQRGYGLTNGDKRFSLFNTHRWKDADLSSVPGLGTVPVLIQFQLNTSIINNMVDELRYRGSLASPGYDNPEGVMVYISSLDKTLKVLIENDDIPKGLVV